MKILKSLCLVIIVMLVGKVCVYSEELIMDLVKFVIPAYVILGIKGKSAYDNAIQHINFKYMLKIERFSTYSAVVFTGILGGYGFKGFDD